MIGVISLLSQGNLGFRVCVLFFSRSLSLERSQTRDPTQTLTNHNTRAMRRTHLYQLPLSNSKTITNSSAVAGTAADSQKRPREHPPQSRCAVRKLNSAVVAPCAFAPPGWSPDLLVAGLVLSILLCTSRALLCSSSFVLELAWILIPWQSASSPIA
jgi:hypothetical protein